MGWTERLGVREPGKPAEPPASVLLSFRPLLNASFRSHRSAPFSKSECERAVSRVVLKSR
jgi:hypothetical protein